MVAVNATAANHRLLSQELFDETVLENEECFDLSPDDALRETIDQFRRQLGGGKEGTGTTIDDDGVVSNDVDCCHPALSHLILSHPNTEMGRRERDEREQFANRLAYLDGFVMSDGTLILDQGAAGGGNGVESRNEVVGSIVRTMEDIGRRCRYGYGNDGTPCKNHRSMEDDDDDDFATNDDEGDEGCAIAGVSEGGAAVISVVKSGPYPNLATFHRTSSIYTLMSFLGIIVDPTSPSSYYYHHRASRPTRGMAACHGELRILSSSARALSSIFAAEHRGVSEKRNIENDDADADMISSIRSELRDSFVPALGRLVCLVYGIARAMDDACAATASASVDDDEEDDASLLLSSSLCDLLRLGTDATRGCEMAKVAWVRSVLPGTNDDVVDSGNVLIPRRAGGAHVVVSCLSAMTMATTMADEDAVVGRRRPWDDARASTMTEACRLLASLCRYDDHRDVSGPGPKSSSAHDHAVEFHRSGASTSLIGIARVALSGITDGISASGGTVDERLVSAALTALRVMAVNDEVIQTMVALGVLPIASDALRRVASDDDGGDDNRVLSRRRGFAAASLGLIRNLCGNDEIKTNLCLGSSTTTNDRSSKSATPSVLPHVIRAMRTYPSVALVQEHACGTFAAMSLRRPANARAILDAGGPRFVITAMKRHDGNVNVQRQGALAIRNIVSRLLRDTPGEDGGDTAIDTGVEIRTSIRDAFLELGAEDVLQNIAGQHQGSVDEAYAALRDLGCQVSLVKFNADDVGVSRTMMFGEKHNSSFRPVYEESAGLADGVDCAISRCGS